MVEDIYLINKVLNGNSKEQKDSFDELHNRHKGLFCKIVNTYAPRDQLEKNNILEDETFIFFNSMKKYDPSRKTKFSSFLANETRWICQNTANKTNKITKEDESELNKISSSEKNTCTYNTDKVVFNTKIIISKNFDDLTKKVFKYKYFSKKKNAMTWEEIAEKLGVSVQTCIRRRNFRYSHWIR